MGTPHCRARSSKPRAISGEGALADFFWHLRLLAALSILSPGFW
jgi:hypothetical protein